MYSDGSYKKMKLKRLAGQNKVHLPLLSIEQEANNNYKTTLICRD